MITLHKLSAGTYHADGCLVERHTSGWRWSLYGDASVGGEWRSTRREAVLDLEAYLATRNKPTAGSV